MITFYILFTVKTNYEAVQNIQAVITDRHVHSWVIPVVDNASIK